MVSFELSARWEAGFLRLHGRGALGAASLWQEIGQFPVSILRLLFNYLPIKRKPQTEGFELFFMKWPLLRSTSVLCSRKIFLACFGDPLSCTLCCNGECDVYSVTQCAFEWSVNSNRPFPSAAPPPSLPFKAILRRNLCFDNRSFCRCGGYFDFYCFERRYGMLRRKINMYVPLEHPTIFMWDNRNQNAAVSVKRSISHNFNMNENWYS